MVVDETNNYNNNPSNKIEDNFIEVELTDEKSFSRICEVLTRIGIPNFNRHTLYQTAHILQKKGRYYIVHFKQMLMLDRRSTNLDQTDISRVRAIARLLEQWGLLKIINDPNTSEYDRSSIHLFVINRQQLDQWKLVSKYVFGHNNFDNNSHSY